MTLKYHAGQIDVQSEANTRPVAEMLADWVGPVAEFVSVADLILLATASERGGFDVRARSGAPPLTQPFSEGALFLPDVHPSVEDAAVGGLAINLAQRRRARLNGRLNAAHDGCVLEAAEAFTNCRKYIAPSVALEEQPHVGPERQDELDLDDLWLAAVLARCETAFLATASPAGLPDLSHRGGPPGFLVLDAEEQILHWPEYVGDGMFKSAGNVRANGSVTLFALDMVTGDAAALTGVASYRTLSTRKEARTAGLERHQKNFPVQGEMTLRIERASRLKALVRPRKRIEGVAKITSCSPIDDQAPQ